MQQICGWASVLTSMLGIRGRQSPRPTSSQTREQTPTEMQVPILRFHRVHGKAISLHENSTIAKRQEGYFEHSVVFSHRPIGVDEVLSIEIIETTECFHGPMKIGFTSINPSTFATQDVPLGRDLRDKPGFWIKSVHINNWTVGTKIFYKLNGNGNVLYELTGQQSGVIFRGVDITQPLWAIFEAYGTVQAFKLIECPVNIFLEEFEETNSSENINFGVGSSRSGQRRRTRTSENSPSQPSSKRRNGRALSSTSPSTCNSDCKRGLCIICTDSESDTAFIKCGHLCMCYKCAVSFTKRCDSLTNAETRYALRRSRRLRSISICPICRSPIDSLLRIYD